ncbi:MAG: U32 family peptidase [Rikenellaceae bacterium]|jgi:putative protease|nr:U32 family peptidase [Rikenellaceae bacterium]
MTRRDIELMAPVGSFEALWAAIDGGADAIYFGVGGLNMRSRSSANFSPDDMSRIIAEAHAAGLRAYLTLNVILYDDDLDDMRRTLDRAAAEGVDAVIASDQAAIHYARRRGVEVHLSTQLNVSNTETLRFYSAWADVAVLARELTLEQVAAISRAGVCGPCGQPVRIEMFAHGALCMAVSGRCYLSLHDCGESANRGACRQICRRSFTLRDNDSGAEIAADGQWLLSPKDLCTIEFLDRMIAAGVSVLKIEGRARPPEYVLRACRCYDRALRALEAGEYTPELAAGLKAELAEVFNRGFWGGYYLGAPTVELSPRYGTSATTRKVYVGRVTNIYKRISVAEIQIEASPLERGSRILFTGATTRAVEAMADELWLDDRPASLAPQGTLCSVKIAATVHRGDRLFKIVKAD